MSTKNLRNKQLHVHIVRANIQKRVKHVYHVCNVHGNLSQVAFVEVERKTGISKSIIQDGLAHVHGFLAVITLDERHW